MPKAATLRQNDYRRLQSNLLIESTTTHKHQEDCLIFWRRVQYQILQIAISKKRILQQTQGHDQNMISSSDRKNAVYATILALLT